ncbi:uncharacterized protein V1513DRAFT_434902 [Lipomyces chichibuensis]|uniref:uncharacterized protein n=1 Tax=Lipomyces chichibuensis TaxID=1546026 RepID=UPI003343CC11
MVNRRNLVANAYARLQSGNTVASDGDVTREQIHDAKVTAANTEDTVDDAFAIYSYYISVTDHLPSDIRRSLNLMTSLAQKYTAAANDLELLTDAVNGDQYGTIKETFSRIKDVDTTTILSDRRESLREAVRMLQVLRRHYKKLDTEIIKMEKAAQVPITSKIVSTKSSKVKAGTSAELSEVNTLDGGVTASFDSRHKQSAYVKKIGRGKPVSEAQATSSLKPVKKLRLQAPRRQLGDSTTDSNRTQQQEAETSSLSALRRARHVQPGQPPPAVSTRERLRESKQPPAALRESSLNIRHSRRRQPEKFVPEYRGSPRREPQHRQRRKEETEQVVKESKRGLRVSTKRARNITAENPRAVSRLPLKSSIKKVPESIFTEVRALRHRVGASSPQSLPKDTVLSGQHLKRPSQKPSGAEKRKDVRQAIIDELYKKKRGQQDSLKRKAEKEFEEQEKFKRLKSRQKTYCICDDVSYGDMIACDDKNCKIEWYHLGCVNMKRPPKGEWICPLCTERKRNQHKRGARSAW